MSDSAKEDLESREAQVLTREDSEKELEGISAILEGVVTPFAQAQETSEKEATKRAGILAAVANRAILALFGVAFMVLVLAGYALSQGNDSMAEKMVIALLAFFGGLGAGKATGK